MLRLTAFPAQDGDCLLLSYGEGDQIRHVLIDGGRTGTYASLRPALSAIAGAGGRIELLVLSHIDGDHIEGMLKLAADPAIPVPVAEVWFNGFDQMRQVQPMGPKQGDRFSAAIHAARWRWNSTFGGNAVRLSDTDGPQDVTLEGGLKLTMLSPTAGKLKVMRRVWAKWRTAEAARQAEAERAKALTVPGNLQAMGLKPMPSRLDVEALAADREEIDDEPPNGSSIAFIAEWQGKRVLLAADAHPDLLARGLRGLSGAGRYHLDLVKVSHHGSLRNTSRDLIEAMDCQRFVLSTNGARHGHPDPQAIARILKFAGSDPKTLYFNYRQPYTVPWNQTKLREAYGYDCSFPPVTHQGTLAIEV